MNLPSDARSVLYRKYACVLLDHVLSVAADDLVAVVPHAYDAAFMNLLQTEASNRNVTLLELSPGSDPDIVDRLIDEDGALLHLLGGSRLSLPFLKPFMQLGPISCFLECRMVSRALRMSSSTFFGCTKTIQHWHGSLWTHASESGQRS